MCKWIKSDLYHVNVLLVLPEESVNIREQLGHPEEGRSLFVIYKTSIYIYI